jgi:hypothetical protein
MPFQPLPRLSTAAASVLAAGLMLTVASCTGHLTPIGPDPAATMPQPHQLRSPLVLQHMSTLGPTPAGDCPAGYVTLPGGESPGMCYRTRPTGTPVTITSAAISPVSAFQPPSPPGQQAAPVQYGFWITLPAADASALTAVIPTVTGPQRTQGPTSSRAAPTAALTISVADRTWAIVGYTTRPNGREFEVFLSSMNQALQLQRILAATG